ncbi:hypothetical protein DS745_05570 [Anaerobacillus alkaliphilus]|uniref:Uncharacterized protein n=1 Tax=Anaerobacillus alkaliphilus TaxID=1548597 RepID=A0A4Q0VWS1_9BACI|nr:hypothetical protein [Anaerobacillus alkaliphilus]RXJ02779.1 hypothetical protein DS745_05570 [Anaerobacillus alkaliphilus]
MENYEELISAVGLSDREKILIGTWLDAIGTIISAIGETRELLGLNDINKLLVAIGDGLQGAGPFLIGTAREDEPLAFAGNWIDGAGGATASLGAYREFIGLGEEKDNLRIEFLGYILQSKGASLSAVADYLAGEEQLAVGNAIQSLGAGLEAIGAVLLIKDREREGVPITTLGAILQAIGANYNAIIITRDYLEET